MATVRPDGALLEELLALAPVGLALLDEHRRYMWVNEELARINGKSVAEHVGHFVDEVIPSLGPRVRPLHLRGLEKGEVVRNVEVSPVNGHRPHILVSYYPIETAGVRALAVIAVEITERLRMEEALSEAQRLARIGSWEWSAAGAEMSWSPELSRIIGIEHEEGPHTLDAFLGTVHPDDVDGVRSALFESFHRRERFEVELRVLPPGEAERVVNVIGKPVLEVDGSLLGYLGTVQDVTERAHSQAAVAALAASRGRLAAQVLQAEEDTRRGISELLHDHALQELLAARQDLAEALAGPAAAAEHAARALESVERAVRQLREAVADLHPVLLEEAGLEAALSAVAEHRARHGGFACRVEVDPEAAGFHDTLLVSLTRELLTNVARHARAGHASVVVRRAGEWIELVVSDDGCGAAAGRPAAALREGHIGLAALARRVEALGGRFEFASEPGRGARVRAAIPL